ncbi:MAG TPA: TlpA disulfide reductase family protein [Chryseosolibacter sp.]|nr:TlpA disulfide reductase family protein [Chryseosolibacter sp.]
MNRILIAGLVSLGLAACKKDSEDVNLLKTGQWRGVIEIQGHDLPVNFEVTRDEKGGYDAYLRNADERLLLDEVNVKGDSVDIGLHIFDANIRARISGDSLEGVFVKNYEKDYRLPFRAGYGQDFRFFENDSTEAAVDFTGKYEVTFLHPSDSDASKTDTTIAVGLFHQKGPHATGTFMTTTGDYRFLDGDVNDSIMYLSAFDGNHAYLFRAAMQHDGSLRGEFLSGKTWRESWVATKKEQAELPDAESLTYMKKGYDRITFSFPDADGRQVSLGDEKYKGKVVILQLLGTWCPNCMDETRFLAPWYDKNRDRGIEVIGLAYERKADFGYASERVKTMVEKMGVSYDILIAGTSEKGSASKSLPMLNAVMAFPTTIYIGKDGKVKKIHTGFTGPGTGEYFERFITDFNETVNGLLKEDLTARR